MSKATYMVLSESIVVSIRKGPITVHKDDPRYNRVLDLIRDNELDMDKMELVLDNEISWKGTGLELRDNNLYLEGDQQAMPQELSERIQDYRKKGLPMTSLVNFWKKLKKNPSFNSRKMLFKFLEVNNHPFTEDGDFLAYRSVTEDFKDHHTKTFDNSPGSECKVDRSEVDDNPNNVCSHGLHVASWSYASNFGSNRKMVEVFVSPEDVVCVPVDYNNTKMRVCRFVVVKEVEAPIKNQTVYGIEDEENDEDSCMDCGEALDSNDYYPYSKETVDEILALYDQFRDRYQDDALDQRISEECHLDASDVHDILSNWAEDY